jgi:hypothetical protein
MNDIEAGGTDLQQQAANTKSIAEGRELIVGFLDDTVTLTDRMLREVEAVGYPTSKAERTSPATSARSSGK